jgi:hypothetical protein
MGCTHAQDKADTRIQNFCEEDFCYIGTVKSLIKVALGEKSCCFSSCHSVDVSINPGIPKKMLPQHSYSELWQSQTLERLRKLCHRCIRRALTNLPSRKLPGLTAHHNAKFCLCLHFFPPSLSHVHIDFVVPPASCGRSVTDF